MKPPLFEYAAPASLEETLELLAQHGDEAKLLAGGQSLIPTLNFRMAAPALLVDLNGLAELDYVERSNGALRIGAIVRQRRLERDALVAEFAPLLHETVPHIAHPQIRNRGTLGGSLVHADPAAELPAVAVACGARCRLCSQAGERWVAAADFFQGMFAVDLAPEEILVEVEWPAIPPNTGWSFQEFARRHGDYAMMGVAAMVTIQDGRCSQARLIYLNAGDGPVVGHNAARALLGEAPTPQGIAAAADAAATQDVDPLGNVHASVDYQRHLARVLTRRALQVAIERAKS